MPWQALAEHDVNVARTDVRKAEALHKIMHRLTQAHPTPTWQRQLQRQDRQLDGLAYSILKDTSGVAAGLGPDRWSHDDAHARGAREHSGRFPREGHAGNAEDGENGGHGRGIGRAAKAQLRSLANSVQVCVCLSVWVAVWVCVCLPVLGGSASQSPSLARARARSRSLSLFLSLALSVDQSHSLSLSLSACRAGAF